MLKAVTPASKIGNLGLILPAKDVTSEQALMSEFIITFFLLFCVIAMIDKGRPDRSTISLPLVTGLIVCVNVFYAVSKIFVLEDSFLHLYVYIRVCECMYT